MILGVMSDTHGNLDLMRRAAEQMRLLGAEVLYHLGDDYRDAEELVAEGFVVRQVPGLWCPEYQDSRILHCFVDCYDGVDVACAHADRDLRHQERAAAIVMTGHTHTAQVVMLGRSLYVNPGHLKAPMSRDEPASFATVTIEAQNVTGRIHDAVTGEIRRELTVPRDRLA